MTTPTRSPARKSGLFEQDQNLAGHITEPSKGDPSKRRQSRPSHIKSARSSAVSGINEGAAGSVPVSFQLGTDGGVGDLSPRRKARRSMQPRKSILKANIFAQREDETTDFTAARGSMTENLSHLAQARDGDPPADYTIAMRPSLARRVSFATKAHVRMFQDAAPRSPSKRQSLSAPRPSSGLRRSSIQGSVAIQAPRFIGEGEGGGEASMEMDTASEQSDSSDDDGDEAPVVQIGAARRLSSQSAQVAGVATQSPGDVSRIDQAQDAGSDDGSDGEMDMEATQAIGGVMDRRTSLGPSEASEGNSLLSAGAEDQTVDFTIAVGGLMPRSPPPEGANNGRTSIGYAAPNSPISANTRFLPGQSHAGDNDEVPMEETIAIGGIIGADDTMSTASSGANGSMVNRDRTMTFSFTPQHSRSEAAQGDEEGEMDMTVAIGGVMTVDVTQQHTASGPRRSIPSSPFPTSARSTTGGTPSFARPTVSSATKTKSTTKRNVFAPSPDPSPTKPTTPRKSGMETAAEVAKRLSFGSASSATDASGSRKRARSVSVGETTLAGTTLAEVPSKKRMIAENVFAPATSAPEPVIVYRAEMHLGVQAAYAQPQMGTPRKSVSAPNRLSVLPSKSPAKSPMLRRMLGQEEAVPADDGPEGEFDPPTISLGTFLEMAGVQFIETLPGPRRRSSVARGVLGQSQMGEREFALHDYTAAQVNNVLLNMYSWAANRMKIDMSESAAQLAQTEVDCSVHNPPVIKEYLSAGDDEKKIFELTFKAFKTNTQLKARERWYDWKMDLMQRVRPDVEEVLDSMTEDKERLDEMEEQTAALLPQLRARQAALIEELKKERQAVAELAECDQEELKELREAINEQGAQIKAFSSELSESTTQLDKLESNLSELRAKKSEAMGAISIAKGMCDQFTKSDVFRLQDEYKSLQALHLWRPIFMTPDALTLSFDAEIQLSMDCKASTPDFASAQVELLPLNAGALVGRAVGYRWLGKGESPTTGLFRVFQLAVRRLAVSAATNKGNLNTFIRQVGQLWSAVQRIRQELRLVHVRYPTTFRTNQDQRFEAVTNIVYPARRSKVELIVTIDDGTLLAWPAGVADIPVHVRSVYGASDDTALAQVARRTVGLAVPEGYLGYLLQVCVDVSEN